MATPSSATFKRLFAVSGNRCAFPDCNMPLSEESGTITGEVCHIGAVNPGGPRFNDAQTDQERHAAANLILLCSRHHKIVDSEPLKYTKEILIEFKSRHEQRGVVEITPAIAKIADALLKNYLSVTIQSNSGQIAIHSPGAIQANTVNLRTTKAPKVNVTPPSGSIGDNRLMISYATYLISRYQEFQKAHSDKTDRFKYMAIYSALKREFKCDWKLLSADRFDELITYLQKRINNSKLGRIQRAKNIKNYHSFDEHA